MATSWSISASFAASFFSHINAQRSPIFISPTCVQHAHAHAPSAPRQHPSFVIYITRIRTYATTYIHHTRVSTRCWREYIYLHARKKIEGRRNFRGYKEKSQLFVIYNFLSVSPYLSTSLYLSYSSQLLVLTFLFLLLLLYIQYIHTYTHTYIHIYTYIYVRMCMYTVYLIFFMCIHIIYIFSFSFFSRWRCSRIKSLCNVHIPI